MHFFSDVMLRFCSVRYSSFKASQVFLDGDKRMIPAAVFGVSGCETAVGVMSGILL